MTMKTDLVNYYRLHDSYLRYAHSEARTKQLSDVYKSNKRYFGNRVLDLACGGGVLGFILEQRRHNYTGVDINPDMISAARDHAKHVGSRNLFLKAEVTQLRIGGRFDTICMLGNALWHFSVSDFARVLQKVTPHGARGSHFIVDYRDLVSLMFHKQWNLKTKLVQRDRGRISITKGCDSKAGFVIVATSDLSGRNKVQFAHAIWSPFIISAIMREHGWVLKRRQLSKRWAGWLDVYRKT